MWRCPGRARQPRATGRAGIRGYGDTGVPGYRVWVLSCSLEALEDVTGEGPKVTGHLRPVPKIKWNISGPACAKQHVHIYKCHTFAFVLRSYFFDTKLTISLVKNDLMMLLYYEAYYKIWNQ